MINVLDVTFCNYINKAASYFNPNYGSPLFSLSMYQDRI